MIEKIYNYSKYSINFHFYFSDYKRCCLLSIPSTNTKLFTFYYTFIFTTITYFSYHSPKKLIFAYYILSVSLSCYISSSMAQITFHNAPQNFPINRCNPSPETTISQVTTYQCFCSPHQKIYSFVYFPLQRCFPTAM